MVTRGLVLSLGLLVCMMKRLLQHVGLARQRERAGGCWRVAVVSGEEALPGLHPQPCCHRCDLACRHSSAVPLGSRGGSDRQQNRYITSCLKVGPFAPVKHPQDILSVSDEQADLSQVQLGAVNEAHQRGSRLARSPDAGLRRWADYMELKASASNGSSVLEGSGSYVTVWWKGVPWLARPLEYWVGMWLQVPAPIPSLTTTPTQRQRFGLAQTLFESPPAPHGTCAEERACRVQGTRGDTGLRARLACLACRGRG
jgi:hypothetical protein